MIIRALYYAGSGTAGCVHFLIGGIIVCLRINIYLIVILFDPAFTLLTVSMQ